MQTNAEIRRARLAMLIEQAGGVEKLAEKVEKSSAQISQWANASKDSRTGKPRGISDDVTRHIEAACGKERGWMDQPTEGTAAEAVPIENVAKSDDEVRLLLQFRTLDPDGGGRLRVLAALADELREQRSQQGSQERKLTAAAAKSA